MTDERRTEPPEGGDPNAALDLLSIGLLVFFVSLLLIVGALLAMPVVLG